MIIEVIATSLYDAVAIEKYGADRIELIENLSIGGITPDLRLSEEICNCVNIPVNIMVRPHAESFIYDNHDMRQIEGDIDHIASKVRANAIVFGSLDESGNINFVQLERVLKILERTRMSLTFHRAIDACNNPLQAFKELQQYKGTALERVLSSGGMKTAIEGQSIIQQMNEVSKSNNGVKVLAGSGLSSLNVKDFLNCTGVDEVHFGTGLRGDNLQLQKNLFEQLHLNLS